MDDPVLQQFYLSSSSPSQSSVPKVPNDNDNDNDNENDNDNDSDRENDDDDDDDIYNNNKKIQPSRNLRSARCPPIVFSKVLTARNTNLMTARVAKNKRFARDTPIMVLSYLSRY